MPTSTEVGDSARRSSITAGVERLRPRLKARTDSTMNASTAGRRRDQKWLARAALFSAVKGTAGATGSTAVAAIIWWAQHLQ